MKPYYIVVTDPDHKPEVLEQLLSDTGSDTIPDRAVELHNEREWSEHTFQVMLTDEEAETLFQDDRVESVEVDPTIYGKIKLVPKGRRTGVFNCSPSTNLSTHLNYGLDRSTTSTNNFSTTYTSPDQNFDFNLDGTGVDVIIMDTGVTPGHPEFAVNADGTGGTRVVSHDWTQYGVIRNTPTGGFLGDCDGHGSNVASIIAGNTRGWAPGAAIYSLRCIGSGAATEHEITTGATLTLLSPVDCFDTVRLFHLAKPVTSTGYRRPTIVNCSFGYNDFYYSSLTSVNYRGTSYAVSTTSGVASTLYGTIGEAEGGDGSFGARVSYVEAAITSCINAGVIVIASAGNNAHKIDVTTGSDYNNYVIMPDEPGNPRYYHRGSTPEAVQGVICVGALDNVYTNYDAKAYFSSTGPRVDIFAPGVYIMGAYSSSRYGSLNAIRDPRNTSYWLNKIAGTSQASPQVAGVAACVAQARPWMTATNMLNFLQSVSQKSAMNENALVGNTYGLGSTGTYTNLTSLQGAPNYILQQPFVSYNPLNMS
jgi:subtilisin family serine protease